jgi:hypothetical protein
LKSAISLPAWNGEANSIMARQANFLPTVTDTRHGRLLSQRPITPELQRCTQCLTILVTLTFWPFFHHAARLLSGHALAPPRPAKIFASRNGALGI